MTAPVIEGCEPLSVAGGPIGVLVLHGFTGSPFSMRGIAEQMANAGFSVEMPLLPGHGTSLDDMIPTRFSDWLGAADAAYESLAARTEQVVVVGLSMGGTLTCALAERHGEIAGIALVNPLVEPASPEMIEGITPGAGGELQLTDAIKALLQHEKVYGYSYVGKRHDAGDKQGFLRATVELGLKHPKLGADLRAWLKSQTF